MSLNTREYASLANESYKDYKVGIRKSGQEKVIIDGVQYEILEHVNNRLNGYQGTIYQRLDTRIIVVAHRGTEEIGRDGFLTDGSMALNRANPQSKDAIELTRHALDFAWREGKMPGSRSPEVTVTGHSLGGTLAQIAAHHFDLKGETFNAYGAVSLGYRIPEGGDNMVNHVMATDVVSAASPHFGQVRVYALPDEIKRLSTLGDYENNRSLVRDPIRNTTLAAGASLGAHSMHNFLGVDGNGRPDRSVLSDVRTQQLAKEFDPMIDKYRSDIEVMRAGMTMGARGPVGMGKDLFNEIRSTLPPGAPAASEAREAEALQARQAASKAAADALEARMAEIGARHPRPGHSWFVNPDPAVSRGSANVPAALPGLGGGSLHDNPSTLFLDRMLAAAQSGDTAGFRQLTQQLANQEPGRALRNEAIAIVDNQECQTALDAQLRQSQQQAEPAVQTHAPRMR